MWISCAGVILLIQVERPSSGKDFCFGDYFGFSLLW